MFHITPLVTTDDDVSLPEELTQTLTVAEQSQS